MFTKKELFDFVLYFTHNGYSIEAAYTEWLKGRGLTDLKELSKPKGFNEDQMIRFSQYCFNHSCGDHSEDLKQWLIGENLIKRRDELREQLAKSKKPND